MEDIHLGEYAKQTSVHAQAVEDGDNGFENQPEYGRKYDPRHDKRGTSTIRLNTRRSMH
jgi:hypothetical protein